MRGRSKSVVSLKPAGGAACALLAVLLTAGGVRAECTEVPFFVRGNSLTPFIGDGETIQGGHLGEGCGEPARGDLLLFTHLGVKVPLLKIVIGLPGDRFGVKAGDRGAWNLLINGAVAKNAEGLSYRLGKPRGDLIGLYAKGADGVIPPNAWLVMGDNPAGTDDSSRFGLITRDAALGFAVRPPSARTGLASQDAGAGAQAASPRPGTVHEEASPASGAP